MAWQLGKFDGKFDGHGDENWAEGVYMRPGQTLDSLSAQAKVR